MTLIIPHDGRCSRVCLGLTTGLNPIVSVNIVLVPNNPPVVQVKPVGAE